MTPDKAREQGQTDARQGKGHANTSTWDYTNRNAYDAAFERQRQEQLKKK